MPFEPSKKILLRKIFPLIALVFVISYFIYSKNLNFFLKISPVESYKTSPKPTSTPTSVPTLTPTPTESFVQTPKITFTPIPTSTPTPPLPSQPPPQQSVASSPPSQISGMAQEIIFLINQERRTNGLSALKKNAQLDTSALSKARDMIAKNYWGHTSPDGNDPWIFVDQAGYKYTEVGENLARGYFDAGSVVNGWMSSEGHRSNILGSNYKDVGIVIVNGVLDNQQTKIIVSHFGSSSY